MPGNKLDDYRVVDTLSAGRFGLKQLVCRLSDRRLFEWRQISYRSMDDALKEMVISEINSLKKLHHPNVIHHEDVIIRRETYSLYLITECGDSETLQKLIDIHIQKKELIEEELIWSILSQLSQALHSLTVVHDPYRSQIFHRCLKPSSVYLNIEEGKIKIGDFALGLMTKPFYQCPEWQKFGLCNEKSDVWSMGCISYELCTLQRPFRELDLDESQVTEWKLEPLPKVYSQDLESILKFILTPDEDTRPSALMVLHHPIFRERKINSSGAGRINFKMLADGLLETDFPVAKENLEDTFVNPSAVLDSSDLSLNNYLSMMSCGVEPAADEDVRSVQSLESGTALPKASSSVLHTPPRQRSEIQHLERWAKMLEEKELELVHKEKRLQLWEAQLAEVQRYIPARRNMRKVEKEPANESSGVETLSIDSTQSLCRPALDSVRQPLITSTTRMEPIRVHQPIAQPYNRHESDKRTVQFHQSSQGKDEDEQSPTNPHFAEQRVRWLEMKKKRHLAPAASQPAPPAIQQSFAEMEEKAIPVPSTINRRYRFSPGRQSNKENHAQQQQQAMKPPARTLETPVLSSELRAKLKSHNLPGLR